jgi:hypothetical protein
MSKVAEKQLDQIGMTRGCEHHDYDLIHELDIRLNFLWRCDQYIANAEGNASLQDLWREVKRREQETVQKIKDHIAEEVKKGCF